MVNLFQYCNTMFGIEFPKFFLTNDFYYSSTKLIIFKRVSWTGSVNRYSLIQKNRIFTRKCEKTILCMRNVITRYTRGKFRELWEMWFIPNTVTTDFCPPQHTSLHYLYIDAYVTSIAQSTYHHFQQDCQFLDRKSVV